MSTRPRNTGYWLLGSAIVVAIGVCCWLAFRPPQPTKTAAETAVTDASRSGDYASVRKAVESGQLSQEDVRVAVREEFEHQTLERVNHYFDTTDPAARRQVLDKAIDDLERFRAEARKRAAATTAPATQTSITDDPRLAMAAWALSQPPGTRARLAEFRVALDKRRAERGLPGLLDGGRTLPLGTK